MASSNPSRDNDKNVCHMSQETLRDGFPNLHIASYRGPSFGEAQHVTSGNVIS